MKKQFFIYKTIYFTLNANKTTLIIETNIKRIKFEIFNKLKNNINNISNKNAKLFILKRSTFLYT